MADFNVTVIDERSRTNSTSIDTSTYPNCGVSFRSTSDWNYALAVSAKGSVSAKPTKITKTTVREHFLHSHFPNRPSSLFLQDCYLPTLIRDNQVVATYAKYSVRTPDEDKVSLVDPRPDAQDTDTGGNTDGLFSLALSILSAFVSPWRALALTAFSFFLSRDVPDPIEVKRYAPTSATYEEYTWDFILDRYKGLSGFPSSRSKTGGIQIGVYNRTLGSGSILSLKLTSVFGFRVLSHGGYCPCEDYVYVNRSETISYSYPVVG